MPTLLLDDIDVPVEERTLYSRLGALGADYEIQRAMRKSAWVPKVVEHIHIFLHEYSAEAHVAAGYVLKTIGDTFVGWAKDRLKRAPQNTEKLIIYGADEKPLKTITVTKDSVEERPNR